MIKSTTPFQSAPHLDHRILVVEDDHGFASLIQKVMQQAGFSTETVSTGADAIKWIEEVRGALDILLLLDYRLPDMTGKELIEILSQDQTTVPFIMITGHGDEKVAVEMMKLGARDYLIKDKNLLDLLPIVVNTVIRGLANEQQMARTEEELQESEKKFRSIFESFTDVYYRSDKESRISIISPSVRAFGYEPEELIGRLPSDFYFDVSEREIFLNELNKHGEVRDYEIRLKDKNGKLINVSVNAHKIYDKDGNPDGIEGVLRDITHRKWAEKALLETNARLQMLQQLTATVHTTLNLEEVFKQITDGIIDSPGYTTALVIIRNDEKNAFELKAMSTKRILPQIDQILGFHLKKLSFAADPELNYALKSAMEGNVVTANTLVEIAYPIIGKKMCLTLQNLRKTKKYIVIPLKVEKKVVGGILISSRREEVSEEELAMIKTFADVASQAIKNATLHTQTKQTEKLLKKRHAEVKQLLGAEQQRVQHISGLVDVVHQIRVGMSKPEIFQRIVEVIYNNLNWQTVVITQCDADFTNSRFITGVGLPDEELKKLERSVEKTKEKRPSFKERFLQDKFKVSRSYFIPEESGGTELLKEPNVVIAEEYALGEWKQGDFLLVPILNRESNALGIITVDRPRDGNRPDEDAVRILELFADQVAVAIENIGLYQEAKQEALHSKSLMEVTNAINSTMSVDELLGLIVEKVLELTDSKRGALFLFDDTGKTLSIRASRGISDKAIPNLRFKKGESIAGLVAETGKGVLIHDVENHPRFKRVTSMRIALSLINVPLMVGGKVAGVIGINRLEGEEPFTEHEFSIAQDFANQASLALEKTRLFSETQRRSARLQKLYDLSVTLTGDTQSVFDKIVSILVELFDVPIATVKEFSGDNLIVRSMYLEGDILRGDVYPLRGTPCENIRSLKKPCVLTDAMSEFPENSFFIEHGIRAFLGVPVLDRSGSVVSLIILMDTRKRSFTDEDNELLYTFSDRIYFELEEEQRRKEQEQMLQALTESEERYRSIFKNTLVGVFRSLPEGRFIHVNPALVRMLGYDSTEEVLGLRLPEDLYVNPAQKQKLRDKYEPIGSMEAVELVWKKKGGERIVVSLHVREVYDAQGNVTHNEGMVLDVTKRKQGEEKLEQHLNQTKALQYVVEKLNRTVILKEIYSIAIEGILNVLHVDRASVLLADSDGVVRFKAWEGLSPEYRKAVEGHFPWEIDDLQAQPIFLRDIARADLSEELKSTVLNEGIHAYAFIPLKGSRTLLGKFMIYYNQPHFYESDEINLSTVLADNLATAVERLQGWEKLKKSEEKYRTLVEEMNEGLMMTDTDEVITMVNTRMCEIMGAIDKSQLVGHILYDFLDNKNRSILDEATKRRRTGVSETYELTLKRIDGTPVVIQISASSILDDKGRYIGSFGVGSDITEKKQAEERIRQLSAFPEENPHPVFSTDLKGKVKYANPAAIHISEEIGGKRRNITWLLPMNRKKLIEEALKEKKVVMTDEYKRGNGVFVCQIHISEDSNVAHLYLTEVTKRVRQEEESQRLLTAVEQAADSIIITDAKGAIQYVNPLFEKTTGYLQKGVIGQNLRNYKSGLSEGSYPQDAVRGQDYNQYQEIWDIITSGQVWSGHLSHKNIDGELYEEETTISPIRDKSGKIHDFVFVCRDVTQEIALEEQLRQAQKLEAIGQLAGGIAHDFNNILTGIIGYSDLALASLPIGHELRDSFDAIIKKSDDAAILIRQLLAFSRKQILDIRLSDLNHILQYIAQFLERVLRDDIKLTIKLNKSPCSFNADTTAIQQIITNLCVNAQDSMPYGGDITISTSNVTLDESYCRTRPEIKPGEYIKLSVSDTGTGIEKDIRDHIYEPFFTTKEVGVGSGLGLSTVYGLVRQHNGYIECISTPGKGTVFELYFPQMKKAVPQKKEVTTVEKVEGKETILIVEDDIDVLNVLKNILNQSGYSTLIAKNGLDGLEILTLKRKDIDLIITDIYMPEMSGIELYEKTIELGNMMQFLFITGHASQEIKSMTDLGLELLQKPFTSIQLTQKIREILDK